MTRPIHELNETEVRSQYITPAIKQAGWDHATQIREEYTIAAGRIQVTGKVAHRKKKEFADYLLSIRPGIPLAVVEAKDAKHPVGAGMQQALGYADRLDTPFVFTSNGKSFVFHDRTVTDGPIEQELSLDEFPSPDYLHQRWREWKGLTEEQAHVVEQDYYFEGDKEPRYYQLQAVNRAVEAVARGKDRVLLVMATGTGKTFTAFQIIWRLWKSRRCKRVLFLADRNILVDQTKNNDFKPFGQALVKVAGHKVDPSYEIFLSLYQAISGSEEEMNVYKEFDPDFFDLIIIDECHRGSAKEAAQWRKILDYFSSAVQIGMTATPKEDKDVSNIDYFGDPVFTYSLKQGIEDGFLAPYKVVRMDLDKDLQGWRPEQGQLDKYGEEIEDRIYNATDYDSTLILEQRTRTVAEKITEYLKGTDRYAKTIVFCQNQDHAERMRRELINLNADLVNENRNYVMRITGDDEAGKKMLDTFINPEERFPVIVTTSELLSTGVDAQTCKLIVIDQRIKSMTKFKQVIGRGTRIREDYGKLYFTIMDFRKATELFADKDFDGEPVQHHLFTPDTSPVPPDEEAADEPTDGLDDPMDPTQHPEYVEPDDPKTPRVTYVVDDVPVSVMAERVQYIGPDGRLITESITDYTRSRVLDQYATLDDFLKYWNEAERKQVIIDELADHGVLFEALQEDVGKDFSAFDLICHVVFDQPALTRQQRADNVRKTGYFDTYEGPARQVLEALLEKYADEGFEPDADARILRINPFPDLGTPVQLVKEFGGKDEFHKAVRGLERKLYEVA